jgi:phage gpG-like protein
MFKLVHNTEQVAARLRGRGAAMRESVRQCFIRIALWLQRDIQTNALEGQALKHRSGKLIGSIRQWTEFGDREAIAIVEGGGGVAPYGEIHEFGGTFMIPAHMSTSRLGKPFEVRAHSATFPERSFMRWRLREGEGMFLDWIERAVSEGIQK